MDSHDHFQPGSCHDLVPASKHISYSEIRMFIYSQLEFSTLKIIHLQKCQFHQNFCINKYLVHLSHCFNQYVTSFVHFVQIGHPYYCSVIHHLVTESIVSHYCNFNNCNKAEYFECFNKIKHC